MTTTKKKTATTRSTTARTRAPKADASVKSEAATPEVDNAFLSTFRTGMGVIEHTSLSVAEVPLKVLSTLGLPDQATGVAREGHRQMVHGIHGTLNTVATQTVNLTGKGFSLVSGVVGGSSKA